MLNGAMPPRRLEGATGKCEVTVLILIALISSRIGVSIHHSLIALAAT